MKEMTVMLVFQINNNYKLHLFHVAFVSIYENRRADKVFFIYTTLVNAQDMIYCKMQSIQSHQS